MTMINFIVMPMFIARANLTRVFVIHNSCMFTSTTKESGIGKEAVKDYFIDPIEGTFERNQHTKVL